MVNKGLTIFQSKQDIAAAEELCKRALEIDPECEPAVGSLAQLALQTNRVEEGSKLFWRQAEITRSEPELMGALTYHYVSVLCFSFFGSSCVGGIGWGADLCSRLRSPRSIS